MGATSFYVKQVIFLFRDLHIYVTFSMVKTLRPVLFLCGTCMYTFSIITDLERG